MARPPGISGVYYIRNTLTGHAYIGSSTHLENRRRAHFWAMRYGRHECRHLQSAFRKYGIDAFEWHVAALCDKAACVETEQAHMDAFVAAHGRGKLYNACLFASLKQHSEETRRLIGDAHRGKVVRPETLERMRQANLGKKHSEEHKAKIAAAGRGRVKSKTTREKLRAAGLARVFTDEQIERVRAQGYANRGRVPTPEQRARMAAAQEGRTHTEETKAKIGAAHKGRAPGDETRAKMSDAQRRRFADDSQRQAMSEAQQRRYATPEGQEAIRRMSEARRGRKASVETRAKLSEAHTGARNGHAKITEDQAREILRLLDDGRTQQSIADRFGIKQPQVSRIALGTSWGHLRCQEKKPTPSSTS